MWCGMMVGRAITNRFLIGVMPQLISASTSCVCVNIPISTALDVQQHSMAISKF